MSSLLVAYKRNEQVKNILLPEFVQLYFIQPPKEDGKETEVEEVAEKKEEKQEEKEKRETKEVQTAEIKTDNIPQKSPKKIKTVQCKVMLLDGTEYSCDLEVRHEAFI